MPRASRRGDAVDAGDAVVDRHQQVGRAAGTLRVVREFDDLGRQAIAVFEAVRHEIVDLRAEHAQAAHGDGAGGRAVAVVVGDDEQRPLRRDRFREQCGGLGGAFELEGRDEFRQRRFDFVRHAHAARGVKAGQHGM